VEGYGFIESSEGVELYFHRNSVLKASFEKLAVGTEVSFVEEKGDRGPQAAVVRIVGRRQGASGG
jgi:cold shock CspA family protein